MDLNSIKGITGAGFDGATGGTDVGDQRGVVLGKGMGGHGYDAKLGFCYGVLGEAEVGVDVIAYYLVQSSCDHRVVGEDGQLYEGLLVGLWAART